MDPRKVIATLYVLFDCHRCPQPTKWVPEWFLFSTPCFGTSLSGPKELMVAGLATRQSSWWESHTSRFNPSLKKIVLKKTSGPQKGVKIHIMWKQHFTCSLAWSRYVMVCLPTYIPYRRPRETPFGRALVHTRQTVARGILLEGAGRAFPSVFARCNDFINIVLGRSDGSGHRNRLAFCPMCLKDLHTETHVCDVSCVLPKFVIRNGKLH